MRGMPTLALKDLRVLARDKLGLFWVLGFPLLYALLFGAILGGGGSGGASPMPIAVVDEDSSAASRAFMADLGRSAAVELQPSAGIDDAKDRVRRGKLVAYVRLEKGFGESLALFGGEGSPIEVGIDPSRRTESGFLQGVLMEATFRSLQSRISDPAAMRARVQQGLHDLDASADSSLPQAQRDVLRGFLGSLDQYLGSVRPDLYEKGLSFGAGTGDAVGGGGGIHLVPVTPKDDGPRSSFEITFPSAILWGVLGCTSAFALSLVRERLGGTMLRLQVSPLSRMQILAGKGLACFLACAAVMTLLMLVGALAFHVRVGSATGLAMAIVSTACCFVGIMMLLSTMGRTIQGVSGAGWGTFVVMAMFGGGMIPLIAMPPWMLTLSNLSPVKWGILALEGAIWRGFSLTEMLLPCGILLAVGIAGFLGGAAIFSRRSG